MNCASRLVFSFILALASPLQADLILEGGKAAFAKGDYPAAANAFRSALSTDDPSAGLYYNLAMAEQKGGQRAEAALSLRRALTLDPRMVDAQIAFLLLFTIFARAGRMLPLAGAAGLLVLGLGIFLLGYLSDPRVAQRNVAVVRDSEGVALLSSPANQSTTVTRLPAASPVRILQERGEWTFCSARGGEKGWVTSKSLEAVVPAA
jgi:tetratricopeptide (TPR) repeat protein